MDGKIANINSCAMKGGENVDFNTAASILYSNGNIANVQCSACCCHKGVIIICENGSIEVNAVNLPRHIKVMDKAGTVIEEYTAPDTDLSGYELEFLASKEAIEHGWTEHPIMPHSTTLRIMQMMDTIRHQNQIIFPNDSRSL